MPDLERRLEPHGTGARPPVPFRQVMMVLALVAVAMTWLAGAAPAGDFAVPRSEARQVWEAEAARGAGEATIVADPAASAGSYVDADGRENLVLEFPFTADEATTLTVRPRWWRTGEQKLGRRYPYPLSPQPGPDAMDSLGHLVYFTAPAAGRVGVADARLSKLLGPVEVGGYLTDLVADAQTRRVYVADALGDRIVVLDSGGRKVASDIPTPAEPCSLALHEGTLYVACRAGRQLLALDTASLQVVQSVKTAAEPVNLEIVGDPPTALAVRFQQKAFDAQDLSPQPADELQYHGLGPSTMVSAQYWDVKRGWWSTGKRYSRARAHVLLVQDGEERTEVDVSAVTQAKPLAEGQPPQPLDDPGPTRFAVCGDYVFFTSPATGRVGALKMETGEVAAVLEVGGHVSDLVAADSPGLVYAADATGNQVVVIDAQKLAVVRHTKVLAEPWSLAYFGEAAIQRKWLKAGVEEWPRTKVETVYVACRAAKALIALDAASGKVRKTVRLDVGPRFVRRVQMPNVNWWELMPDDRIAFALHPRAAVDLEPLVLNLDTLAQTPYPTHTIAEPLPRRTQTKVAIDESKTVTVSGQNTLLLRFDEQRMDVSAVADPQLVPQRPLTERDEVGSISLALDEGPQHDWTRGVWMTPDNEMFLVHPSEEYWEWNQPGFKVAPGRHVLRVRLHSPHVRLDAIEVGRTPRQWLQARIRPEPHSLHGTVPLPSYQGLFYDKEEVRFSVQLTNLAATARELQVEWTLQNYMDETVDRGQTTVQASPHLPVHQDLSFAPRDTGRFTLTLRVRTEDGDMVETVRFLRLPKLEHPRLFVRRDELPEVRKRIAQYPTLFTRYVQWLRRMAPRQGDWNQRFLPPGLTWDEMASAAPADFKGTDHERTLAYGWRMFEAAWRMDATLFAAMYIAPEVAPEAKEELLQALKPLLEARETSIYCTNHFHGPLFPGAVAALVDMAPDEMRRSMPLYKFMEPWRGDGGVLSWWLVTIEEPVTPADRAMIYKLANLENNMERYFMSHQARRGGMWWLTPFTSCQCPMQGTHTTFVYLSNLFDEPRLFEKFFFQGFLTLHEYIDPLQDTRQLLPARRGPLAEPWRWIMTAQAKHPLETHLYRWDDWVAKLDGPLPNEDEAVDKLMALEGMPYVGPIRGGQNHFTTGVAPPVALALGWYEPGQPGVERSELPPTTIFEAEGWTVMRSGWEPGSTEVYLGCGVREHGDRTIPNHVMIWRGGEVLIGWPALWEDDGNNTPAWGNVVVTGDWQNRWVMNLAHPRDGEHFVINRFSKPTWTYITRNGELTGFHPAEGGFGGGLNLHGHTETPYRREGITIAYQTRPEFDYVAGDAANSWSLDEMIENYRQLLFVKPDTVVIYDRIKLGEGSDDSALVLAVGPEVSVEGRDFTVRSGNSSLRGTVLLPAQPKVTTPEPFAYFRWKGQKLVMVRIEPAQSQQGKWVEYLTILRTGGKELPALEARLVADEAEAGVAWTMADGQAVQALFNRPGRIVGGEVVLGRGANAQRYVLPQTIEDTYVHWAADPRYQAWTSQPRFQFVLPPEH